MNKEEVLHVMVKTEQDELPEGRSRLLITMVVDTDYDPVSLSELVLEQTKSLTHVKSVRTFSVSLLLHEW